MFRLDGKVALVTGAARGLGAGIAIGLAKAGAAAVVVNDLELTPAAEKTLDEIRAAGAQATFIAADVRKEEQVKAIFAEIDKLYKHIDILVNNAGITRREDIFSTTLESWNDVLDTHLTSTFLCSREAMFRMREQKSGRIITNSSVVVWRGAIRGFVHYAAAKAGQIGFTRTLARTAAPYNVTVNAIAPGMIETEMFRESHTKEGVASIAAEIPLGLQTLEDIAAGVIYLASDEAKHVTGSVLDINGGVHFR